MEPDDLLCSRNARPEKALVGPAHGGKRQTTVLILEERIEIVLARQHTQA